MFRDRTQAGQILGRLVRANGSVPGTVVLALPRGGVPVGVEVAKLIGGAALDVFPVRKLGVPEQEELAFGAIATGGIRVLNRAVIADAGLPEEAIERIAQKEQIELDRREQIYRGGRPPLDFRGRLVVLVDDGLATGATMLAAVQAVKQRSPQRVVAAVPVASRAARKDLRAQADEVICAEVPHPFRAVGYWYEDFKQVTDDEVRELLNRSRTRSSTPHSALRTNGSAGSE